ncbi:O-antigen ligase [Parelusimicrobium proximum]|uniref:O-antigen ligase family protein n=1 Tax=Parelusimicrobium proximum TaxID=3228953 RepID=UPI003D179130
MEEGRLKDIKFFSMALMVFLAPLIFFPSLTENPFYAQGFVLLGSFLVFFCVCLYSGKLKKTPLDSVFLIFMLSLILSSVISVFLVRADRLASVSYSIKGVMLILVYVAGYFVGTQAEVKEDIFSLKTQKLHPVLIWAAAWLMFSFLGQYYTYFMWCVGIMLAANFLRKGDITDILHLVFVCAVTASLFVIFQVLGFNFSIPAQLGLTTTFGNPNFFSSFIVLVLPSLLVYFFNAKERDKKFYFSAALLLVTALFMTGARSSLFGFLFLIVFAFCSKVIRAEIIYHKKQCLMLLLIPVLAALILPSNYKKDNFAKVTEPFTYVASLNKDNAGLVAPVHQRMLAYLSAIKIFKSSPFMGEGFGEFQLAYAEKQAEIIKDNPKLAPMKTQANGAHNFILQILAETGIFGGVMVVVFICFLQLIIWEYIIDRDAYEKTAKVTPANKAIFLARREMLFAFLAGIYAFLIDNLLNITFFITMPAFFFWLYIGLLLSLIGSNKSYYKVSKIKFGFYAALSCVLFAWLCVNFLGELFLLRGIKLNHKGSYKSAQIEFDRAVYMDPMNMRAHYYSGHNLLALGRNKESARMFTRSSLLGPNYEETFFNAGILLYSVGDIEGFKYNMGRVLRLDPYNMTAIKLLDSVKEQEPAAAAAQSVETGESAGSL